MTRGSVFAAGSELVNGALSAHGVLSSSVGTVGPGCVTSSSVGELVAEEVAQVVDPLINSGGVSVGEAPDAGAVDVRRKVASSRGV